MRKAVTDILGDPIPTPLVQLAKYVNEALRQAEESNEASSRFQEIVKAEKARSSHLAEALQDALFLHPRNVGSHFYPGCSNGKDVFTSDCKYCKCWMGPSRSGGPEGMDPFGDCPGNPRLRTAYELLKSDSD